MTTPNQENTGEQATESFRGLSWEGRLEERFHWGSAATDIANEQATNEAAVQGGVGNIFPPQSMRLLTCSARRPPRPVSFTGRLETPLLVRSGTSEVQTSCRSRLACLRLRLDQAVVSCTGSAVVLVMTTGLGAQQTSLLSRPTLRDRVRLNYPCRHVC